MSSLWRDEPGTDQELRPGLPFMLQDGDGWREAEIAIDVICNLPPWLGQGTSPIWNPRADMGPCPHKPALLASWGQVGDPR